METRRSNLKQTSTLIGIILTATMAIAFFTNNAILYLVGIWAPQLLNEPWFALTVNAIGLYVIGFTLFSALMKKVPSYNEDEETNEYTIAKMQENESNNIEVKKYSIKEIIFLMFISLAALYASNMITVAINTLIALLKGTDVINPLQTIISTSSLVYTFIYVCIVAPVVEELMFRKILLNKLLPYGKKLSIVVSAFAFGLFHGNLYQILYAFIIGLILAHITISARTIKYSIILHIIINTLGSVVLPSLVLNGTEAAALLAVLILFVCMVTGIVLFITKRKVLFPKLEEEIELDQQGAVKISTSLLSTGMIVFWATIIALIIARTFFLNF